jgi:hypothetical protein
MDKVRADYASTHILSIPRVKSEKRRQSMSEVTRNRTQFMALGSASQWLVVFYTRCGSFVLVSGASDSSAC